MLRWDDGQRIGRARLLQRHEFSLRFSDMINAVPACELVHPLEAPTSRKTTQVRAAIAGTGCYLPERILTNDDLERQVETNDEWIVSRTGIRQRRVAGPDETTSSMAAEAARRACADAGIDPAEIDLIIVATVSPDYPFPSTACLVQHAIGARNAACFDLEAACTGFIYAATVAQSMIASGANRTVLVIGAETMTRLLDYQDRCSCILFGDGAGAVLFRAASDGSGIQHTKIAADGSGAMLMQIPAGGSRRPASSATVAAREHYIRIAGRQVFKFATETFVALLRDAMQACELTPETLDLVIPHQVNLRIIEAAFKRLALPMDKVFLNIEKYGNTSAASVPIALDEARRAGRVCPGNTVVLVGFGAGLTWGSTVVRI